MAFVVRSLHKRVFPRCYPTMIDQQEPWKTYAFTFLFKCPRSKFFLVRFLFLNCWKCRIAWYRRVCEKKFRHLKIINSANWCIIFLDSNNHFPPIASIAVLSLTFCCLAVRSVYFSAFPTATCSIFVFHPSLYHNRLVPWAQLILVRPYKIWRFQQAV